MKNRIFLLGLFFMTTLYSQEEKIGLLTHPRSGTQWFMYTLVHGANCFWRKEGRLWHNFQKEVDPNRPLLLHSHHTNAFSRFQPDKDKIILLVRNYRESIIRRNGASKIESIIKNIEEKKWGSFQAIWYFENLAFFDRWPEENRLLVYYEDMIRNPRETFDRVMNFIGEDSEILDEFFADYEKHKNYCLAWRNRQPGPMRAVSKGKDLSFHTKRISPSAAKRFDLAVKKSYPVLWEKYLHQYEL